MTYSVDFFVPKSNWCIEQYFGIFEKNVSNSRDNVKKSGIFHLFVPKSKKYINVYFIFFYRNGQKNYINFA